MPRFNANITMMYGEHDFLDRFKAAKADGFTGVEYLFPYDYQPDQLVERLQANGLTQVLHNLPAGDWAAGERGMAAVPGRESQFQESVGKALEYAKALGCPQCNCLAGIPPADADPQRVERTFVDNLKFAAAEFEKAGVKLLIEAINTRDIPGFHLTTSAQAMDVIAKVGSQNLYFQYDFYHMQIMEGDLAPTFQKLMDKIPHVQIADTPGRHEPGTGEINYPFLFKMLDEVGYQGWVGCEYKPKAGTSAGLGWFEPYKSA